MSKEKSKILIIDDDRAICSSISLLLKRRGYLPKSIFSQAIASETIESFIPDLILLDMNFTIDTSGKQGLKLLKKIGLDFPEIPVVLLTGWATVQLAVEGMKLGAKDFFAKPWDNSHLISSIETILSLYSRKSKQTDVIQIDNFDIIGESPEFKLVLDIAKKVAKTNANVLITGESGTGKEVIAEAIHNWSDRVNQNFVKVNLGGISSSLFESEMFGHQRGAFTDAIRNREGRFSIADKGTIFLDEIGDLPLQNQVKLLRVLQERTYEVLGSSETRKTDVRVISATNKNLSEMVGFGEFREDLFYRINLITIHIPPLRQRREDIRLLVDHFVSKASKLYNIDKPYIHNETHEYLGNQEYPGNVRQLKNIIDRTLLLNLNKRELTWKDFKNIEESQLNDDMISLPDVGTLTLEQIEVEMIKKTLNFHNNSISGAAKSLGITRSSLYRRLEKYNIPHES